MTSPVDPLVLAERLEKIAETLANLDLLEDSVEKVANARWNAVAEAREIADTLRQAAPPQTEPMKE